jgi:hypothetical protein
MAETMPFSEEFMDARVDALLARVWDELVVRVGTICLGAGVRPRDLAAFADGDTGVVEVMEADVAHALAGSLVGAPAVGTRPGDIRLYASWADGQFTATDLYIDVPESASGAPAAAPTPA